MTIEFDKETQSKIKMLRRKELIPIIFQYILIVFLPSSLLSALLLLAPAWAEREMIGLFIQNFVVVSLMIGVVYTIIRFIKKQNNLLSFNIPIEPDTETQGIIYQHQIVTVNNLGERAAFVKIVVPNLNYFMYCVVPLDSDDYEIGKTVDVKYDSKILKGQIPCMVYLIPDYSAIEKTGVEH